MKRKITNVILAAVLVGCCAWVAVAPATVALIPVFIGLCAGEALVTLNTDCRTY